MKIIMKNRNYLLNIFLLFINIRRNLCEIEVGPCIIKDSDVCENDLIDYYFATGNGDQMAVIKLNSTKNEQFIRSIKFEQNETLKIIIHGYAGGIDFNPTKQIQKAYLDSGHRNLLTVDWGKLVRLPCYPTAAWNTKYAGECVARFLRKLQKKNSDFNPPKIHIIGFSLGAHVAGFVSNALQRDTGKKINRITGLDPALPFFATSDPAWKLDATDADFVDVVHTCAGIFGKIEPSGHVDFYINGGQFQPNCNSSSNYPLCNHIMATTFFAESIDSDVGFWGVRCSSYFQFLFGWCGNKSQIENSDRVLMGERCENSSSGIVFVYTGEEPPYAMGENLLFKK